MCCVCTEFNKGKLTTREAMKALWEVAQFTNDSDIIHLQEFYALLEQKNKEVDRSE